MLQLIAALFFVAALIVPLGVIALTIQKSDEAVLSALRGPDGLSVSPAPPARLRTRPRPAPARRRPMRAAA